MATRRVTIIFLLSLTTAAVALCFVIALPFLKPILSAAVIAIVFFPVHARVSRLVRNSSLSALVSTILVILVVLVPAVLIGIAVTRELGDLYHVLTEQSSESGGLTAYLFRLSERPLAWVGRYVDISGVDLRATLINIVRQAIGFLLGQGAGALSNVASFAVNSVITLFTLFFLFREGKPLRRRAAAVLPLTPQQVDRLFGGINDAIVGTMYGGLAVALAQGSLTSLAFAVLGLPSPILWGLVTAMFSLVPLIGSAAVWLPASIILILSGSWGKGIILLVVGAGVISTIDNLIRPYVISGRVRLHTLLVFFAVLGGIKTFGIIGLFLGPIALAVTTALFGMLREEGRAWQAGWRQDSTASGS